MGFPVGYTEVFIPTVLIHTLTFLSLLRKLILTLFYYLGLPPGFLEPGPIPIDGPPPPAHSTAAQQPSLSAVLLRELLPLERVSGGGSDVEERENCAVCLYGFCRGEEIRWLANCHHIFHRECLDRWMDLDHRTCPLCRTPVLRHDLIHVFNQRLLAATGACDDHDQPLYVNYNHTVFSSS